LTAHDQKQEAETAGDRVLEERKIEDRIGTDTEKHHEVQPPHQGRENGGTQSDQHVF
jgi:hypothetical protein